MNKFSRTEHVLLALWAADCAERVLPVFELHCPGDERPRKAVEAARKWADGKLRTNEARKCAFAAHAAARSTQNPECAAAARSAAHAAATAHVATHAIHAASYAAKASGSPASETEWQLNKMPVLFRLRTDLKFPSC